MVAVDTLGRPKLRLGKYSQPALRLNKIEMQPRCAHETIIARCGPAAADVERAREQDRDEHLGGQIGSRRCRSRSS
eukprot:872539-Pleurochrysis_carterae.AAC.1